MLEFPRGLICSPRICDLVLVCLPGVAAERKWKEWKRAVFRGRLRESSVSVRQPCFTIPYETFFPFASPPTFPIHILPSSLPFFVVPPAPFPYRFNLRVLILDFFHPTTAFCCSYAFVSVLFLFSLFLLLLFSSSVYNRKASHLTLNSIFSSYHVFSIFHPRILPFSLSVCNSNNTFYWGNFFSLSDFY